MFGRMHEHVRDLEYCFPRYINCMEMCGELMSNPLIPQLFTTLLHEPFLDYFVLPYNALGMDFVTSM